jgi:hypothetical protein
MLEKAPPSILDNERENEELQRQVTYENQVSTQSTEQEMTQEKTEDCQSLTDNDDPSDWTDDQVFKSTQKFDVYDDNDENEDDGDDAANPAPIDFSQVDPFTQAEEEEEEEEVVKPNSKQVRLDPKFVDTDEILMV